MRSQVKITLYRRYLTRTFLRYSSNAASLVKASFVPAPHYGSIQVLTLNNPKSRNAISRALLTELTRHVEAIQNEGSQGPTRALILASDIDASFCAGADLKERRTFTNDETTNFLATLRSTFTAISNLPVPTITALSSLALGGGLELALTTHLRVFSSSALVALPESRLGIIPGAGGTYRLPSVVGRNRALDMMLTGRRVGGAEAYFMGLCDRLVDVGDKEGLEAGVARKRVLEVAVELATCICEGGPRALKAVIESTGGGEKVENAGYDTVVRTRDRNEALEAFVEKRQPIFRGI